MRFANGQYTTTDVYEDTLELTEKVRQKAEKLIKTTAALRLQLLRKKKFVSEQLKSLFQK